MAKITISDPALIGDQPNSSNIKVQPNGDVIMHPRTLTYTRKRRPFWVVDLYAIRGTMRVAEPDDQ